MTNISEYEYIRVKIFEYPSICWSLTLNKMFPSVFPWTVWKAVASMPSLVNAAAVTETAVLTTTVSCYSHFQYKYQLARHRRVQTGTGSLGNRNIGICFQPDHWKCLWLSPTKPYNFQTRILIPPLLDYVVLANAKLVGDIW